MLSSYTVISAITADYDVLKEEWVGSGKVQVSKQETGEETIKEVYETELLTGWTSDDVFTKIADEIERLMQDSDALD